MTTNINQLFEEGKTKLEQVLSKANFVSLTGDFRTSISNDSYLGVIAHWIDDGWIFQSATLQVKHVTERHTADQCATEFRDVVEEWNLNGKTEAVCTDKRKEYPSGHEQNRL